jgi:hypothetical protein
VVVTRDFAEGEVIAEVDGVTWYEHENRDDRYSLLIDEGVFYDMVDQTRWINHSCEPNADVESGIREDGSVWARVVALRPLRAGEELFYDYAFAVEVAEPCRCGVPTCRGWIVDEDELPTLLESLAPKKQRQAG